MEDTESREKVRSRIRPHCRRDGMLEAENDDMKRRTLVRSLATVGAASVVSRVFSARVGGQARVRYESHGRGPIVIVGPPITASKSGASDPMAGLRQGYIDRLTDRYRVIVLDYPPTGADAAAVVDSFDPDRVCTDVLSVADAAGGDGFARYGYSWSGDGAHQIAATPLRLRVLVSGG